jgi:indole-3-glycerol phosphate synthase
MSATFLETMAASSLGRAQAARRRHSCDDLVASIEHLPAPPALRLHPRFDVFAEIKLRSPAAGSMASADDDIAARARAYAAGGAAAVSVLTEPDRFDGSIDHLATVAQALAPGDIPTLRKDFLVDACQLAEARAAGAGGALLILRLLERRQAEWLVGAARRLRLFLLLEAFDEADLGVARALVDALGPEGLLVGVNCRDLTTLEVRSGRLLELAPGLPAGVPCVAESGIASPSAARQAAQAGYRIALVGSALMRSADPATAVTEMIAAGREP